jgi:hypothetical protein
MPTTTVPVLMPLPSESRASFSNGGWPAAIRAGFSCSRFWFSCSRCWFNA